MKKLPQEIRNMDAYDFTALGIELTLQNEEYEERARKLKAENA